MEAILYPSFPLSFISLIFPTYFSNELIPEGNLLFSTSFSVSEVDFEEISKLFFPSILKIVTSLEVILILELLNSMALSFSLLLVSIFTPYELPPRVKVELLSKVIFPFAPFSPSLV
jgi:hypothetical protein